MKKETLIALVLFSILALVFYYFANEIATKFINMINLIQLNYFSQFETIDLLRKQ